MAVPRVKAIRALVVRGGGADYHDQAEGHWIDGRIATPMGRWPEYRARRASFGLNVLGSLVVEAEAEDGTVGVGVTAGGEPGAWIAEAHLSRFVEGHALGSVADIEDMWDRMYLGSLFYGRRGLAVNVVSGIDLALWDLLGRLQGRPVWDLLGGRGRDELAFYATGPRPDLAQGMGFAGGKVPLAHPPAAGEAGFEENVAAFAAVRAAVGPGFPLMLDCWMALDVPYALRLARALEPHGLRWIEEPLLPDDLPAHRALRKALGGACLLATGEHEATRWGFAALAEAGAADVLQPDVGWCGGLTELRRIAEVADAARLPMVPHGSSVYSYHFAAAREPRPWDQPFSEFLMMAPAGDRVIPMFAPLLLGEPLPDGGRLRVGDAPGFGVELNRDLPARRPHPR